jgi:SWI/SNF-related matrix-associated actin-dependent regulator of chromatin subfamily A containing DEAD/H box 1
MEHSTQRAAPESQYTYSYDEIHDDGDDLFGDYEPTLPLYDHTQATVPTGPTPPARLNRHLPYNLPVFPNSATQPTQPTQILNTPPRPQPAPAVQVAGSSPLRATPPRYSQSSQQPISRVTAMAPPGTRFNPPRPVPASQPVEPDSDDVIVELSSGDERNMARANITTTSFTSGTRQNPLRVEDTPKRNSSGLFDMSKYSYSTVPQKRPNEAEDYSVDSKRPQLPRQTGPARAIPVHVNLSLNDIPDIEIRQKVEMLQRIIGRGQNRVMPGVEACLDALKKANYNYRRALQILSQSIDSDRSGDESDPIQTIAPMKKSTVKRDLQAPIKTIHDRYATNKPAVQKPLLKENAKKPIDLTPLPILTPPRPRGKLVRGRRQRTPSPVVIEDGEDERVISEEEEGEEVGEGFDARVLKFFNTCDVQNLADISLQEQDIAHYIISKRPEGGFKSLDQINKIKIDASGKGKKGASRAKPIGEKVVDVCYEMLGALDAVDELVQKCEKYSQRITGAIAKWGIDASAKDGELSLTSVDIANDSGIGSTVSSRAATVDDDSEDDVQLIKNRPANANSLIQKPSIMSKDLILKDYQVVGLNWLVTNYNLETSCILADDMGLGKTCQVIAFLSHLLEVGRSGVHLVVVPSSTLENWLREFNNFSPEIHVVPYYGTLCLRCKVR